MAGIDAVRPGRDRGAPFRDRKYERHQRAETKIRLGFRENIKKFAENTPQLFNGHRGPVRAVKVYMPPLAGVTANVPKRASTKRAVLGSNGQAAYARARLEL